MSVTYPADATATTYLLTIRAGVGSLDAAADAFSAYASATINTARAYGQIAHATWSRRPDPGEAISPEVLGVDLWTDAGQMNAYYELGLGFEHFGPVLAGEPQTSVWQAAEGQWTEW